jgi:hypothetical protein
MTKFIDLTGKQFTRLFVLKRVENDKNGNPQWLCECKCGNFKTVLGGNLRNGDIQSCGCLYTELLIKRNTTHGLSRHPLYKCYQNMIHRCYDEASANYQYYGGRGIKVCERWLGKDGFKNFIADVGDRPEGKTLDRYSDNNGDYEPGNVRWATPKEQRANSRDAKDQKWFYGRGPNDEMIVENNQSYIARVFGLCRSKVSACLNNRRHTHKGWTFKFIDQL